MMLYHLNACDIKRVYLSALIIRINKSCAKAKRVTLSHGNQPKTCIDAIQFVLNPF